MDDVIGLPARHKVDVDAYYRMGEAGIFSPSDRVELIEGDIIDMAPIGQGHEANVSSLNHVLVMACGTRGIVSPQNSLRLNRLNAPQPDLVVLRYKPDFYAIGPRPTPADTFLVIEVADTSLQFDRTVKLPLYARAGIPEYWIVDLKHRRLDAHRTPSGDAYAEVTTHVSGEKLALVAAPEIVVELALFFG